MAFQSRRRPPQAGGGSVPPLAPAPPLLLSPEATAAGPEAVARLTSDISAAGHGIILRVQYLGTQVVVFAASRQHLSTCKDAFDLYIYVEVPINHLSIPYDEFVPILNYV